MCIDSHDWDVQCRELVRLKLSEERVRLLEAVTARISKNYKQESENALRGFEVDELGAGHTILVPRDIFRTKLAKVMASLPAAGVGAAGPVEDAVPDPLHEFTKPDGPLSDFGDSWRMGTNELELYWALYLEARYRRSHPGLMCVHLPENDNGVWACVCASLGL